MSLAELQGQLLLRLGLRPTVAFLQSKAGLARDCQLWGLALKLLRSLGMSAAGVLLLAGCIDPGPNSTSASPPRGVASASRAATLFWEAPTSNTNDSPLTDLAGYRIYYGQNPELLSRIVQIDTVGLQTYVVDDLEPGTWYFAIVAVATNGVESTLSNIVTKTIIAQQGEMPVRPGLMTASPLS
jgi:hypothetical protein